MFPTRAFDCYHFLLTHSNFSNSSINLYLSLSKSLQKHKETRSFSSWSFLIRLFLTRSFPLTPVIAQSSLKILLPSGTMILSLKTGFVFAHDEECLFELIYHVCFMSNKQTSKLYINYNTDNLKQTVFLGTIFHRKFSSCRITSVTTLRLSYTDELHAFRSTGQPYYTTHHPMQYSGPAISKIKRVLIAAGGQHLWPCCWNVATDRTPWVQYYVALKGAAPLRCEHVCVCPSTSRGRMQSPHCLYWLAGAREGKGGHQATPFFDSPPLTPLSFLAFPLYVTVAAAIPTSLAPPHFLGGSRFTWFEYTWIPSGDSSNLTIYQMASTSYGALCRICPGEETSTFWWTDSPFHWP